MANCSDILSENLGRLIRERQTSKTEVAAKAGISASYLSQIISKTNKSPELKRLEAIARVLGVTVSELFQDPRELAASASPLESDGYLEALKSLIEHLVSSGAAPDVIASSVAEFLQKIWRKKK